MLREVIDGGERVDERVVGDDKQERGKGATLLDTASDVDASVCGAIEEGGNAYLVQGAFNKVDEPSRESGAFENCVDPVVVDRVESFCSV